MSSPFLTKVSDQIVVDLSCDKPLQATLHVLLGKALGLTACRVFDGPLVVAESTDRDHVE